MLVVPLIAGSSMSFFGSDVWSKLSIHVAGESEMWYLGSKRRRCVNDESDSLKRLTIGSSVNYIGDQDDVELIAKLLEVRLDFLSILGTVSRKRDQ